MTLTPAYPIEPHKKLSYAEKIGLLLNTTGRFFLAIGKWLKLNHKSVNIR